ncbi:hypothetical protein [Winogradskyella sp.]|uniref:hypothetical protein n=1 Tax=Winogradskyella sp. TaxID=1883156 RepID=UPI0025ED6180|nr:hypothetical protein [Winogradskyella sp.]MBT8245147.1 hypothetical protein [Winogradskyella sp.]
MSCFPLKKDGTDIIIENKTNSTLKNITITTSEMVRTIYVDSIDKEKSLTKFLSMKNNKTDGTYIISYEINDITKQVKNGYYTNGGSLNSSIKFIIEKDTTLVKFGKMKIY